MQIHPFADLFPKLSDSELHDLAADIKAHGQSVPIVVRKSDGVLLDGRNRLAACELASVVPITEERDYDEEQSLHFIASVNLKRRHLSTSQRAAFAAEYAKKLQEYLVVNLPPKGNLLSPGNQNEGISDSEQQAAEEANVSRSSVRTAKRIGEESPELLDEVKAGKVTLNAAKKKLGGGKPKDKLPSADKTPEPVTDQVGNPLPRHVEEIFGSLDEYDSLKKDAVTLRNKARQVVGSRAGFWLTKSFRLVGRDNDSMKWEHVGLEELISQIKLSRPYAKCPYCFAKSNKKCEVCYGYGYVNEGTWKAAPEEKRNECN